jgi:hypothetical protein
MNFFKLLIKKIKEKATEDDLKMWEKLQAKKK